MSSSASNHGFLPGGVSLKYSSPFIAPMMHSVRTEMIEEWCRATRRPLSDLQMADYAFLIKKVSDEVYDIDFIKCRNRQTIFEWCNAQWGEPGPSKQWEETEKLGYNPRLFVRGEDSVVLFRMVWE